jgi:hypothetical protein
MNVHGIKQRRSVELFLATVFFLAAARTRAQEMVVGVNVVNPMRASVADQNTIGAAEEVTPQWMEAVRLHINAVRGAGTASRAAIRSLLRPRRTGRCSRNF